MSAGELVVSTVGRVVNGEIVVVVSVSVVGVDSVACDVVWVDSSAGDDVLEGDSDDKFSVVGSYEAVEFVDSDEGFVEGSVEGSDDSEVLDSYEDGSDDV